MSEVFSSKRVIHCTALVGRQRARLARLREHGDERTVANAERLLRSFERSLLALLAAHRRQRRAARPGGAYGTGAAPAA
jgi:hypothetical protein